MLIGIRHVMCWHILRRRGGEGEREEEREREEVKGEMKEEGGGGVHMLFFSVDLEILIYCRINRPTVKEKCI